MKKIKSYTNKGFSMVELSVAITIMLFLAAASIPILVNYVEKAQRAFDIQTASVIFRAAELAYTSGKDDAYNGYSVCYDEWNSNKNSFNGYNGSIVATPDGYFYKDQKSYPSETEKRIGYYAIRPIAWCRGAQFSGSHSDWENVLMKSTLDKQVQNNKSAGDMQRNYTDELLWCLSHEAAQGETDTHGSKAVRKYDGYSSEYLRFRYTKTMPTYWPDENQPKKAECWIVYRRDDNAMPEVWLGYKKGAVRGTRRMYPDPAPDYK